MATQTAPRTSAAITGSLDEVFLANVYDPNVVRRLLAYGYRYKLNFAIAVLGITGYVVAVVAQPLLIAWGIDSFITSDSGRVPTLIIALFVADTALLGISQFVQFRALARLTTRILFDLRRDMFDNVQKQSPTFFDKNEVGRLMSRMQSDTLAMQEFMEMSIPTIGDLIMLFFIAVVMFVVDWQLSLIALLPFPALVVLLTWWRNYAKPTFIRIRAAISAVNGNLQEGISGVRVTQSLNRQAVNQAHFDELNSEHRNAAIRGAFLSGMLMTPIEFVTMGSIGLVVVVGGSQVLDGTLELGVLAMFVFYLLRFYEPVRIMTLDFTMYQKAMASGARMFELMDVEPEFVDKPDAAQMPAESLQHELRNTNGCQVTAHLLVPGWTTTGDREHHPSAWLPEQVADWMIAGLERGDFYILCLDNEVTAEMDRKRILWGAMDIAENRPALSRWHPDYKGEFESFEP